MTATPTQLDVIRLTAELVAPGYASLRYIEELRERLRTALIAMDVEAELAERAPAFDPEAVAKLQRGLASVRSVLGEERQPIQSSPVVTTAESRLDGGEAV